eukprot:9809664-Karenia_brevis.AAC.1
MNPQEAWGKWNQAIVHLNFCMQLYKIQINAGRHILHEHPLSATSWQLPSVEEVMRQYGVISTYVNMCAYGMKFTDHDGTSPVYKPTKFMTNSPAIAVK